MDHDEGDCRWIDDVVVKLIIVLAAGGGQVLYGQRLESPETAVDTALDNISFTRKKRSRFWAPRQMAPGFCF
jgi:hypothetical protein